jgi:hypothetical protein
MSCDMRTAPDGHRGEYMESMTGKPRAIEDGRFTEHRAYGWASCMIYAELGIQLSARAIREQQMEGLTGDHPDKREDTAALLEAVAGLVREMAYDHAHDGALTDEDWKKALQAVTRQVNWMHGRW